MIFHPTATGVRYARTDMGGAYRWDTAANHWQPMLDWVPDEKIRKLIFADNPAELFGFPPT